jgi:putative ABC transport system permease protein
MSLAIHTASADPRTLAAAVQRQVLAIDPDQPVYRIRTLQELVSESMARRRLSMFLLAIFAAAALLLAAVGIYGIMSYTVAQRAHEVGIRMALGARSLDVVRLVLGQCLWLTLAGIAAGLAGSLLLTNFLSSLLFNVKATDPATFGLVALILMLVALFASFVPAYRATTVDPVNALRQE